MMDDDDPWDWGIDRVVQELCTDRRTWPYCPPMHLLPDLKVLEQSLREQEMDGLLFLRAIDHDILRTEFGLVGPKSIKYRMTIIDSRDYFRSQSRRYQQQYVEKSNINGSRQSRPQGSPTDHLAQDYGAPKADSIPATADAIAPNKRSAPSSAENGSDIASSVSSEDAIQNPPKRKKHVEPTLVTSDIDPDRSRAISTAADDTRIYDAQKDLAPSSTEEGCAPEDVPATTDDASPLHTAATPQSSTKKRKRLLPTLVTPEINPNLNRALPTAADNVRLYDPQNIEPQVIYRGDDGRKRLIPVSESGQDAIDVRKYNDAQDVNAGGSGRLEKSRELAQTARSKPRGQKIFESFSNGYLGKQRFSVDNVFFPGVAMGKEINSQDDNDNFCQLFSNISEGRRLYVHKRMRHLMRSQPRRVNKSGKSYMAVLPYPAHLMPKHQNASFSLMRKASNGEVIATREDISEWPELAYDRAPVAVGSTHEDDELRISFDRPLQLGDPSSYDQWDCEVELEKYRHVKGGDEVLPLYGESDEDGEYDVDTWRDIEEENGSSLEKPLITSKKQPLSRDQVTKAINEGMALLHEEWHTEHLPKWQRKAWNIWTRSRKLRNWRELIKKHRKHADSIANDRLVRMRQEILDQIWTTQRQVRQQCRIMEQSINDREERLWQISILEQKTAPAKPLAVPKGQKFKAREPFSESDEEAMDTECSVESSADELDGFIISDDEHVGVHQLGDSDDSSIEMIDDQASRNTPSDVIPIADSPSPTSTPIADSDRQHTEPSGFAAPMSSIQAAKQEAAAESVNADQSPGVTMHDGSDLVDLTILDDSPEPTPRKPIINVDDSPQTRRATMPKHTAETRSRTSSPALSNVSSDVEILDAPPTESLPCTNPAAIDAIPTNVFEERKDPDRLIISKIHSFPAKAKLTFSRFLFSRNDIGELWQDTLDVLVACRNMEDGIEGMDDEGFTAVKGVLLLFEMYIDCKIHEDQRSRLSQEVCNKLEDSAAKFVPFVSTCREALSSYAHLAAQTEDEDEDEEPISARRRTSTRGDVVEEPISARRRISARGDEDEEPISARRRTSARGDEDEEPISARRRTSTRNDVVEEVDTESPRKRPRKVLENAEARQLRQEDHEMLAEQESRRGLLRKRLASSSSLLRADKAKTIINESKFEHEGFVFVHDDISRRIKEHQVDGVRFMWSQIVSKGSSSPGCLLAHTMGLGKTMQVITFLVAIAEAAASEDATVASQIPENLKVSRTMILCPAGLVINWLDELLTWVPSDILDKIGTFRTVDSSTRLEVRLAMIDAWYKNGGVLIVGYEMFRNILSGRSEDRKTMLFDESTLALVEKQLLKGPNIIITDEAHKLKNSKSKLAVLANRFRSKSRIALTGSPLSNNVEEYHSMIEWIAPNYLGPITEFRAKYVDPIQDGLYVNSTRNQRRKGLKMLEVLKEDIAPKVHRADSSVLRGDLKPKFEFVIKIPLTELQHEVYRLYVNTMLSAPDDAAKVNKSGELHQTTIWSWISMLSLLCNHPECFRRKLTEPKDNKKNSNKRRAEDEVDITPPPSSFSQRLLQEVTGLFDKYSSKMRDIENSHKVKIMAQILDASRDVGDKVLIFTQSRVTLNYLEEFCKRTNRKYARLDGDVPVDKRQQLTKEFNSGRLELYLISTTAGGLGLNMFGANRVIIFDFRWNPINEEQAVGRAYRIGQLKPVYVYRFIAGGTYEEILHNKAVFKTQLSSQLVDKKSIQASAKREKTDFLFEPKEVQQHDLAEFRGMDPNVLDKILDSQSEASTIRGIVMTDTFSREDYDKLTAEEKKEVKQLLDDSQLKRTDPRAWQARVDMRSAELQRKQRWGVLEEFQRQQSQPAFYPQQSQPQTPLHFQHQYYTPPIPPYTPAVPPTAHAPVAGAVSNRPISDSQNAGFARYAAQAPQGKEPIMASGTRTLSLADVGSGANPWLKNGCATPESPNPNTQIGFKTPASETAASTSAENPSASASQPAAASKPAASRLAENPSTSASKPAASSLAGNPSASANNPAASSLAEYLSASASKPTASRLAENPPASASKPAASNLAENPPISDRAKEFLLKIHLLKLYTGVEQKDPSKTIGSKAAAMDLYKKIEEISRNDGDKLEARIKKTVTRLNEEAGFRDSILAAERNTLNIPESLHAFMALHDGPAKLLAEDQGQNAAATNGDPSAWARHEVPLTCIIAASLKRGIREQKDLAPYTKDSALHKQLSADICREAHRAVCEVAARAMPADGIDGRLDKVIRLISHELRDSGALCGALAKSIITPKDFVNQPINFSLFKAHVDVDSHLEAAERDSRTMNRIPGQEVGQSPNPFPPRQRNEEQAPRMSSHLNNRVFGSPKKREAIRELLLFRRKGSPPLAPSNYRREQSGNPRNA